MNRLFLALILFLALPFCAQAAERTCDNNPDVPITITPVFETPTYNVDTDLATLQGLSRDVSRVIPESLTLGLTRYNQVMRVNPASVASDMPDGTTCVKVERVDIMFGYKDVVVYVANDIPPHTCGYDQVLEHEQKHVAVQRQILNDYIPVLQQNLKEYLAENGAQQNKDYAQAVTWLRDNVEAIAEDVMVKITEENTRLQSNIDTPEEYARIGESCNGQLHDVVRKFVRHEQ
jgi:hypothetical protein